MLPAKLASCNDNCDTHLNLNLVSFSTSRKPDALIKLLIQMSLTEVAGKAESTSSSNFDKIPIMYTLIGEQSKRSADTPFHVQRLV